MIRTPKFGIVAGEKSGDILGASLMVSLRERYPNARFLGVGGPEMIALGCESLTSMDRLSVMGFVEPLGRLPELLRLKKRLQDRLIKEDVAAFVGIDSPDFNLRLAKTLQKRGLKTIHFVSPSVWAYRKARIRSIKNAVHLMLTLFPFELEIYKKNGIPVTCVGHPLADQIDFEDRKPAHRRLYGINEKSTVIALMPGSRGGEISRLAPIFLDAAIHSLQKHPQLKFLIPYSGVEAKSLISFQLKRAKIFESDQFRLVQDSHAALSASDFVITASGTATLEAMLLRRPMVICYKLGSISFAIGSRMLKVPYIGLPNLLAGKRLVPEYLQHAVTPKVISKEIDEFIKAPNSYNTIFDHFNNIHNLLRGGASDKAAQAIEELLKPI